MTTIIELDKRKSTIDRFFPTTLPLPVEVRLLERGATDLGRTLVPPPTIRCAIEADVDRLRSFLMGLSADTTHQRFFTRLGSVSPSTVRALLRRADDQNVLLALHGEEIVAHGMCSAVARRVGVAELAIVVADAWRRRGLGRRLTLRLLDEARQRGVREIGMTVLADNHLVLQLIHRTWPEARTIRKDGVLECLVQLVDRSA